MSGQFRTLLIHFFGRFFDVDSTSEDPGVRARVIQFLALLSVPGVMLSFFMLADHPDGSLWVAGTTSVVERAWLRVGDRYVFVSYAMVVMGLLMTFKWDSLFPDRRDYLILTSLPISSSRWFLAKVLSLCAFLSLFTIAINFFSLLLVPRLVAEQSKVTSATVFWEALTAHGAATLGGSLFAALFFAALQGILINVLTPAAFQRISSRIQLISISVLVTLLLITPLVKDSIASLAQNDSPILDYFPCMWFLGLYEALIPGGSLMPRSIIWAYTAMAATAVAGIVFVISYIVGYRRYSKKILESVDGDTFMMRWWKAAAAGILDRTLLRNPVQRATFHFIEKISSRSMKHRVLTALYAGVGLALALSSLFVLDRHYAIPFRLSMRGALEAPLILAFVLVAGLRTTFNVPSELNANWIFQTTGDDRSPHFTRALRKWIFLYRMIPLFAVVAFFEFKLFAPATATFHLAFDLVLTASLIEVFFFKFNKVPFTCSYASSKIQTIVAATAYLFGFTTFLQIAGNLKRAVTTSPARMAVFLLISAAVVVVLRRRGSVANLTFDNSEAELLTISSDRGYWKSGTWGPPPRPERVDVFEGRYRWTNSFRT